MRLSVSIVILSALASLAACGPQTAKTETNTPQATASSNQAAPSTEAGSSVTAGPLTITDLRTRATSPGASVAGGYLTITNSGSEADRLVSATSPRAARMELHEMAMDGTMMTMRPVNDIEVPAGGSVKLEPGGLHLMFMDIPTPFAAGETIPVSLTFAEAGAVEVSLIVPELAAQSGPLPDHEHNHGSDHDAKK